MSKEIGTVLINVKADTAQLVKGMNTAQKTMENSVSEMINTILTLSAAYVSFHSIAKMKNMVSDSLDNADATSKLAEKLALSTEQLSKYQYAAGFAAVSSGELSAAFGAMIRRSNNFVKSGGGAAAKAMDTLGISAKFANKNFTSTDKTFKILLDRLSKMPDGFQKTAVAQDLFSKSAASVLRMANMGTDELAKLGDEATRIGIAIPNSVAAMAATYHDEMDKLSARMTGIENIVSYSMLPAMQSASKAAVTMYDKMFGNTAQSKMKFFGEASQSAIIHVVESIGFMKDAWTGVRLTVAYVELGFYHFSKVIREVIDSALSKINMLIGGLNKVAEFTGMEKVSLFNSDGAKAFNSYIKETNENIDKLTASVSDGRNMAKGFVSIFNENMANIPTSESGNDTNNNTNENSDEQTPAQKKAEKDRITYMQTLQQKSDALKNSFLTEDELFNAKTERDVALADEIFNNKLITEQEHYTLLEEISKQSEDRVTKIALAGMTAREKFSSKSSKAQTSQVLGDITSLTAGMASKNKQMFMINKAAALAQAAISLPASVMKTFEAYPAPLSFVMGGLAAAAGAAQIAAIASASFGGGSTSTPTSNGGYSTTAGTAPSDMIQSQTPEPTSKTITINLGDSAVMGTAAVRSLIDSINDEIGDGARLITA